VSDCGFFGVTLAGIEYVVWVATHHAGSEEFVLHAFVSSGVRALKKEKAFRPLALTLRKKDLEPGSP